MDISWKIEMQASASWATFSWILYMQGNIDDIVAFGDIGVVVDAY